MKWIKWSIGNALFAGALYLVLVYHNHYATNLIKFMCWFSLLPNILTFAFRKSDDLREALANTVSYKVDMWYDLAFTLALAAYGWFGYATLYFLSMAIQQAAKSEVQKDVQIQREANHLIRSSLETQR